MKEEPIPPVIAGAKTVEGADINFPVGENPPCSHEFVVDKTILHRKTFFGSEELSAVIVFCKKCGQLGGSSRIKF